MRYPPPWKSNAPTACLHDVCVCARVRVLTQTSPDEARARHNASVSWTGKRNIADIGGYIEWEGETVLRGVYAKDIPVSGVNNMGQFAPFRDLSSKLYTWDNYYMRPVRAQIELIPRIPVRMLEHVVVKGKEECMCLIIVSAWICSR